MKNDSNAPAVDPAAAGSGLRPGMAVRMTDKALRQGLQGRLDRRTGIYCGPARKDGLIRVHRDGVSFRETYHPSFWEPAPNASDDRRIPAGSRTQTKSDENSG